MTGPDYFPLTDHGGTPVDLERLLPLGIEIADTLDAALRLKGDAESGGISVTLATSTQRRSIIFKRAFAACMDTRSYPVK